LAIPQAPGEARKQEARKQEARKQEARKQEARQWQAVGSGDPVRAWAEQPAAVQERKRYRARPMKPRATGIKR